MATTLRAQVTLHADSGLPRDDAVNTWHFLSASVDPTADSSLAGAALETFYDSVANNLSSGLNGEVDVKFYDLADPNPRTPIDLHDFTITPDTSPRLPNECAIALSYRGILVSGTNPRRRRGRIFLGPLTGDTVTAGAGGDALVTGAAMLDITAAATALMAAGDPANFQWAVFSPTLAGPEPWSVGELSGATLAVVAGFVDDAFDTIRSRGQLATTRVLFP